MEARIDIKKIDRIEIYINKNRKFKDDIVRETGADYCMNGSFYNTDFTPSFHLKVNGKVLTKDPYNYFGYAWNSKNPRLSVVNSIPEPKFDNFVCSYMLVKDGKKLEQNAPNAVRGRTGIGTFPNGDIFLYCSKDGTQNSRSPASLQSYAISAGCKDFLMLDGGGSSQCNFLGKEIESPENNYKGRVVQNYVLIYLKKENNKEDNKEDDKEEEENKNLKPNIVQKYITQNRSYTNRIKTDKKKAMLHSTGTPGATASNFISQWNKPAANVSVEFIIDDSGIYQLLPMGIQSWHSGKSANNTHIACEICEPIEARVLPINWFTISKDGRNNTKYAVSLLQKELYARGYNPKRTDGIFGNATEDSLKKFQKDNGLPSDGYCGKNTLARLQNRNGSFLTYPVSKVQPYFDKVYKNAVQLFAWIIKTRNGKSSEIVCHSEGYRLGIASNHADVMHWFPLHGKSMDTFRADVQKVIDSIKTEPIAPVPTPPPIPQPTPPDDALTKAIDKFVKKGIIGSPDYWAGNVHSPENVHYLITKTAELL